MYTELNVFNINLPMPDVADDRLSISSLQLFDNITSSSILRSNSSQVIAL